MSRLLSSSVLVVGTTVLMAAAGAVFWVVAARLATAEDVGLAGSLVAAGDSLAMFAQLGLNIAIVRALATSSRRAADVVTAALVVVSAGGGLALGYALLLPVTSPPLAEVLSSPLTIALFAVLVAMTALNILTDSVFLALDRIWSYLRLNGVLMGVLKVGLPLVLAGVGAFGLYSSVGLAVAACAAGSVWSILHFLPGPRRPAPSPELLANRGFAAAGYVTYVLTVLPLLVFPVLVVNALGSARAGSYFISFQVATLLNAVVLAVANLSYAEAERARTGRHAVVRRSGLLIVGGSAVGCVAMVAMAPYFLAIFGDHYVDSGTTTLRVLSLACVGAAFNYWGMLRLRLTGNLAAMIGSQAVSTAVMLVLAVALVDRGTVWVAAAWGVGHAVGGLIGWLLTTTVVPFADAAPVRTEELEPA